MSKPWKIWFLKYFLDIALKNDFITPVGMSNFKSGLFISVYGSFVVQRMIFDFIYVILKKAIDSLCENLLYRFKNCFHNYLLGD